MNQSRINQVGKFAEELAKESTDNMELQLVVMSIVFKAVEWADSHPAWVSVQDELPKVDEQTTLSNECVVVDSSGARYFGYYNGTDECWYTDDYTMILFVTHWMQITPPVKKEGNNE